MREWTEERKKEWTEERKKERNEKKEVRRKSTGVREGVKTTPSGSKEPVNINSGKKLDADSAAFSRK